MPPVFRSIFPPPLPFELLEQQLSFPCSPGVREIICFFGGALWRHSLNAVNELVIPGYKKGSLQLLRKAKSEGQLGCKVSLKKRKKRLQLCKNKVDWTTGIWKWAMQINLDTDTIHLHQTVVWMTDVPVSRVSLLCSWSASCPQYIATFWPLCNLFSFSFSFFFYFL